MKIKQIWLLAILFLGAASVAQAQGYNELWKQVNQAEKQSLPQTVIQLTNDIYRKAAAEKNSPQMLKAYCWRAKYRESITPDSFYVDIKGLETWAETTPKPIDRAVLHSLIAAVYSEYVTNNRWQLQQQTDLADSTAAADIREWSGNQFVQKVIQHTQQSLQEKELLIHTSSQIYTPFVEKGDASTYYQHDMFHLLSSRGVEALKNVNGLAADSILNKSIATIYKDLLKAYQIPGKEDAYLLSLLDYVQWRHGEGSRSHLYYVALDQLIESYKPRAICAEVYLAKATYLQVQRKATEALSVCDEAINRYPRYKRIAALKQLKQDILNPSLLVNTAQSAYPQTELELSVTHKNLDGFTVRLYAGNKEVLQQHYALIRPADYEIKDTTLLLKTPASGRYRMKITPDAKAVEEVEHNLLVTSLQMITLSLPGNQCQVAVLDSKSGQPVPNVTVAIIDTHEKVLKEFTTNQWGKVIFAWEGAGQYLWAKKGKDVTTPLLTYYASGGGYNYFNTPTEQVKLLTDRALYRPGQLVYVKGIAYQQCVDSATVVANRNYTVKLLDANQQEVAKHEVCTNEFGSFTATFTLPAACLNGQFTLDTDKGSTHIRVEEYKRPTFDIAFDTQQGLYKLGDQIQVKGRVQTFSGVSLQDISVQYSVVRNMGYGRPGVQATANPQASGTAMLDQAGRFSLPITLTGEKEDRYAYYTFQVDVTVTNIAGETQTSSYSLAVGNQSLLLSNNLRDRICKDDTITTTFSALNLNHQPVVVHGTYELSKIVGGDTLTVNKGTFVSNRQKILTEWQTLPSGSYQLNFFVTDSLGQVTSEKSQVVLFSTTDTRPAVDTPLWYYGVNTEFDTTHPGVFYIGSSRKDVHLMVDVFTDDKWIESKVLAISDSIIRFEYPYKETYGNKLSIAYCFVKENRVTKQTISLTKRTPDKKLILKWEVFRDKLLPGAKEEWKLTIQTPQKKAAVAEMLATMYDASLDKIEKPNWQWMVYRQLEVFSRYWTVGYQKRNVYNYSFLLKESTLYAMLYDRFITVPITDRNQRASTRVRGLSTANEFGADVLMQKLSYVEPSVEMDTAAGVEMPQATPELRTNFAETAFFYPQLRTNEQGEVSFVFTMPQSLTRWNFRGYAHTKGMQIGMIEGVTTTSKEFMLAPNLPRFVRVGDTTTLAASITNLTGKHLTGNATLTLFDPMTEKVISTQQQPFAVEAGNVVGVRFLLTATDQHQLLGCRLVADGGAFSDGEQQLLPVLSNKETIIETVAMNMRGQQVRTFALNNLFNQHSKTATNRQLTVDFAGNPTWYAVQALPSLSLPTNDNAISWAAAYYANSLAGFIINSQPRIKAVFDSWKVQGVSKETFLGNLQKNQDVKSILLEESPWLMEATTEQDQREQMATLFDLNNMRSNNITALTKLEELQLPSGSWAWCKGMIGNRAITEFVVEMNARLCLLTGMPLDPRALAMQQSAFSYLHQEALQEYRDILKTEKAAGKQIEISPAALKYLYLVAISGEKVPAANQAAYHYLLSRVSKSIATSSMLAKALSAMVLDKAGRKEDAQAYVASLKEHLVGTDELGMYFDFNENTSSLEGLKIPVHVAVMEALGWVANDGETVEEMKLWLLKQKQTQQWNSPIATVNAVYALLNQGSDLLTNQGDVRVTIANRVMETLNPEKNSMQGVNYIKQTFTQKRVVDATHITVEKRDAGIAWGAVYAQYQEHTDQIKQQGTQLNVDKKLYVERLVDGVRQLQPVTPTTVLAVGDKVVSRLTIRLDRAMDFVQLKDQRGACFEPIGNLSGYRWESGASYYVAIKDASTNFFFDRLNKGVYVLESSSRVSRAGVYQAGLVVIQSAYAPEYASHSASIKVVVK